MLPCCLDVDVGVNDNGSSSRQFRKLTDQCNFHRLCPLSEQWDINMSQTSRPEEPQTSKPEEKGAKAKENMISVHI